MGETFEPRFAHTHAESLAAGFGPKERPILFKDRLVRAILEGRKTQTRRLVKPQPINRDGDGFRWSWPVPAYEEGWKFSVLGPNAAANVAEYLQKHARCPYGVPGDRLWVKETWATLPCHDHLAPRDLPRTAPILFASGTDQPFVHSYHRIRPSIFMLRWASRITLDVVSVRVERLQEISQADAKAEGAPPMSETLPLYRDNFRALWDSVNGEREGASWAANPWVWVITFKRAAAVAHAA
jgi:hypothetical protein